MIPGRSLFPPILHLSNHEKEVIGTYFGSSSQDQSTEMSAKRISTHLLRIWNEKEYILHPNTSAISPPEHVALNIFSIELK